MTGRPWAWACEARAARVVCEAHLSKSLPWLFKMAAEINVPLSLARVALRLFLRYAKAILRKNRLFCSLRVLSKMLLIRKNNLRTNIKSVNEIWLLTNPQIKSPIFAVTG